MVTIDFDVSDSFRSQLIEAAKAEGLSVNAFATLALAEKVALRRAVDYLEVRAAQGNRKKLLDILAKAPDVEPAEYDRLD